MASPASPERVRRPSPGRTLGYLLAGTGAAAFSLLLLQLLVGRRLAQQQLVQTGSETAANVVLGEVALERFSPEVLGRISGMELVEGQRPEPGVTAAEAGRGDRRLRWQTQRMQAELCRRLGRCPAVLPAASPRRGVWVEMASPLERVWLFVALPSPRGWPPDPLLLTLSIGLGALGALLLYLTLEIQRPLTRLQEALADVGLEALPEALPHQGAPAVRQLMARFNAMLLRLEESGRERSTMLAGIAHDLRSPLTRLRLRLALAAAGPMAPQELERAQADIRSIERITRQFMIFAGAEAGGGGGGGAPGAGSGAPGAAGPPRRAGAGGGQPARQRPHLWPAAPAGGAAAPGSGGRGRANPRGGRGGGERLRDPGLGLWRGHRPAAVAESHDPLPAARPGPRRGGALRPGHGHRRQGGPRPWRRPAPAGGACGRSTGDRPLRRGAAGLAPGRGVRGRQLQPVTSGPWPVGLPSHLPATMKASMTSPPMPSPLLQPLRVALLVMVLGSTGAAMAQSDPSQIRRPTPAQMQAIFPEQKRLAISDQRARIAILQSGERCLSAAGSSEALRTCMKQQRDNSQRQREQHRAAMRALFERNGIPLPQWGKGDRKGGWGEGRRGTPGTI